MTHHPIEKHFGECSPFLDKVFASLHESGIDVSAYQLDHICYRVQTDEQYIECKNIVSGYAKLLSETMIGGRNIATYKLDQPITYNHRDIWCIELPACKKDSQYKQGYEHVEFVIQGGLEEMMQQYNNIAFNTKSINKEHNPDISIQYDGYSVKFHVYPLEYVITHLQG